MSLLPVPPLRGDSHDDDDVIALLLRGDVEGAAAVLAAVEGLHAGDLGALAVVMRNDPAAIAVTAIVLLAVAVEADREAAET